MIFYFKVRDLIFYLSLFTPSILNLIVHCSLFGLDVFPPGNDPAIWLKDAHAILGNTYPMWEQTRLQYPPLFNSILALLLYLGLEPLSTVKALGIILVSTLNLTFYPLAKELSGSRFGGLIAVWIAGFHPAFYEMYGWGGYPNLLGLALLNLSVYLTYEALNKIEKKPYTVAAILTSSLLVIAHHLTTIVYGVIAVSWAGITVYMYLKSGRRYKSRIFRLALILSSAASSFLLWRAAAGSFQYIVFNPSSLKIRPFDYDAFLWIFKNEFSAFLLLLLTIVGISALIIRRMKMLLIILLAWLLFPFLFTQSYLIGIALDFRRFPMFSVPAVILLASSSLHFLRENLEFKLIRNEESTGVYIADLDRVILASIVLLTVLFNVMVGCTIPFKVHEYYHYITDYAYRGEERLKALNWITRNTKPTDTIVADETLGRWIEGYAKRRVLMTLPPYQIFLVGELERFEASNLILNSNLELRNPYIRIWDGVPYDSRYTPKIAVSTGFDYADILYLVDSHVETTFRCKGGEWSESPYRSKIVYVKWIQRSQGVASFAVRYESRSLAIERVIEVKSEEPVLNIEYRVNPILEAQLIETRMPLWIPWGRTVAYYKSYGNIHWVKIDGVEIEIVCNASAALKPDPRWGQQTLTFTFKPEDNVIEARMTVKFLNVKPCSWARSIYAKSSDELIDFYNVSYIVVAKPKTDMDRLMKDPRFTLVYHNEKIAIFKVIPVSLRVYGFETS